jgi:U2-associated protein SR140
LVDSEREKLDDYLRNLSTTRTSIGEAMVFCLDHAESAADIVLSISQSLASAESNTN